MLLIVAFAVNITRGPDVVMETQGRGADWELGYLGAFLAASLASTYVMYGFDTASSLGEESLNPRKNAPRAILRALIASFIIGGLILLLAMMAVTDINSPGDQHRRAAVHRPRRPRQHDRRSVPVVAW